MNGYIDIVIFAVIAVVLLFRLRSVLGQRSEDEPQGLQMPVATQNKGDVKDVAGQVAFNDNTKAPGSDRWTQNLPDFNLVATATVHNRLTQFLAFDPAFRPDDFLNKAQKAFGLIVQAFSEGNRNTLEFLLSPKLHQEFLQLIDAREANRETYFTQLHGIKSAIISDADLDGTIARVTVSFEAEQSITHKDSEGRFINEQDGHRTTTKDRWVFSKDLKDNKPIWLLEDTLEHDE